MTTATATSTKDKTPNPLLRRPGETIRQQIDRVRETREREEAAMLLSRFIGLAPITVGQFTFPYKKPRGTKAAEVLSISATGIVALSDGTSMHVSHARAVPAGSIA